jgi:hypothetical protein
MVKSCVLQNSDAAQGKPVCTVVIELFDNLQGLWQVVAAVVMDIEVLLSMLLLFFINFSNGGILLSETKFGASEQCQVDVFLRVSPAPGPA